jgi:serine phosphatase RsbU (regulator of sigma subunit)/pSer/pThr/pTyr-binding forkhead associated (FHA) protein
MAQEIAITTPDGKTQTMPLEGERLSLGRSSVNELCYPEDVGLSRQHMTLECENGGWAVRDLGSKNGTYLNGVRISEKMALRPGDRIAASRVVLIYSPTNVAMSKTVVFEGALPTAPSSVTVSTTLESLLKREVKEAKAGPAGAAAAPQWGSESAVRALVKAGRELGVRKPLAELFTTILDLAMEAVGAQRGVLLTLEKGSLEPQASRGEGFRISSTVRDRVVDGKTSLLIQDTQQDEALRQRLSIVAQNVQTLIAVPLQTDNEVIGLLYVDSPRFDRQFGADDLNLLTVMANIAGIGIERERLAEIEQAERVMAAELEQAAEIQRQLLPAAAPETPGLELAGYNAACRTVGGDYYDFISFPEGRMGIIVADVAGKGMPAALLMASLQAKVQAYAETPTEPADIVRRLNRSVAANIPSNRFVTLFHCVVDPRTGELTYCNAGHNPPYLVRAGGEIEQLEGGGPVLGIFAAMKYQQQTVRMEPGDVLLMYSDGVTEACNPQGEEFENQLAELARSKREESAGAIVRAVHEAVQTWIAGQPPADDVTVVVAKRGRG